MEAETSHPDHGNRPRARTVAVAGFLGLCAIGCDAPETEGIEVFPRHFELRPGETVRYTPMERASGGTLQFLDEFEIETGDPQVLELQDGRSLLRAVAPGRTELIVKSAGTQRRYDIDVAGAALSVLDAVPHTDMDMITGEEILFVGHANRDGFDHTAVAKPGIDRWVQEFKERGSQVVYWVSEEYPNWYTDERQPDLAIVSEGQEHEITIDADRVAFTGGGFMFCVLRNVQMTLHGMIRAGVRDELHFIFPTEAIWLEDTWSPGVPSPYPAPMALLGSRWKTADTDIQRYETIVVPFLDRLFTEYPVADYPANAPQPELGVLIDGWNVEVVFGDTFERTYRRADSSRTILMDFRTP